MGYITYVVKGIERQTRGGRGLKNLGGSIIIGIWELLKMTFFKDASVVERMNP